uniref:Uncharacterized protein n=1 Tax=Anguilla anguilla TaxID=7936 RepID=A0A0E9VX49_ANGAN
MPTCCGEKKKGEGFRIPVPIPVFHTRSNVCVLRELAHLCHFQEL